ncbi:PucR family transcriptional regulator [Syntrophomonas erecta]
MSNKPQNLYILIEGVLDQGLAFVASYLESTLETSIIIADYNGRIYYPEISDCHISVDDFFINIPGQAKRREYYFNKKSKTLYYRINYNNSSAYVVVKGREPQIFSYLSVLRVTRLAIKCYFCKLNKNKKSFEKALQQYFLGQSTSSMEDILQLSERNLNIYESYFALLVRKESAYDEIDWHLLKSYSNEFFKKEGYDIIPVIGNECLIMLIPVYEGDKEWHNLKAVLPQNITNYKVMVEERFRIRICIGIGQIYPLSNILKSYHEARITVALIHLTGKNSLIQKFSDLGVYYGVFSQDVHAIKDYCLQRIGLLVEHDCKNEGELLPTLRQLLDSCVNIKSTADSLFIHVNTLYYRMNKIEQILNVDLSQMETRVELYTAIKVWDTLKATGYLDTMKAEEISTGFKPVNIGG